MSIESARRVADAVLWEGYLLYPYRASAPKNQFRWQFGVLVPDGAQTGDPRHHQSECLIEPRADAVTVDVTVRFLQVRRRTEPTPWDEAVAREFSASVTVTGDQTSWDLPFDIPGGSGYDGGDAGPGDGRPVRGDASSGGVDGEPAHGGGHWQSWPLAGRLLVDVARVDDPRELLKLRLRVVNTASWSDPDAARADVLTRSLIACHSVAQVHGGDFLSLRDPPAWARVHASACCNQHVWPVLIDQRTMLSSPIILDDHPKIAPESPIALHDSTEIDELLMLRTATLTDAEKAEVRATDPRGAAILDAAETLPAEVMSRLHGAIRDLQPVASGSGMGGVSRSTGVNVGEEIVSQDTVSRETVSQESGSQETAGQEPFGEEIRDTGGRDVGKKPGREFAHAGAVARSTDSATGTSGVASGGPAALEGTFQTSVSGEAGAKASYGGPPWWDPGVDASVSPETDQIEVSGGWATRGSRVRLKPGPRRSDAQDIFLWGRTATVRAVLFDVENNGYLAVIVDGDPGADLHESLGRFRYFSPDEVELVTEPDAGSGEA